MTKNNGKSKTDQAIDLVINEGLSKQEAAKRLGIRRQGVCTKMQIMGMGGMSDGGRRAIQRANRCPEKIDRVVKSRRSYYRRRRIERCLPEWEAITKAYDAGATYQEIADQYGLTRSAVAGGIYRHRRALEASS